MLLKRGILYCKSFKLVALLHLLIFAQTLVFCQSNLIRDPSFTNTCYRYFNGGTKSGVADGQAWSQLNGMDSVLCDHIHTLRGFKNMVYGGGADITHQIGSQLGWIEIFRKPFGYELINKYDSICAHLPLVTYEQPGHSFFNFKTYSFLGQRIIGNLLKDHRYQLQFYINANSIGYTYVYDQYANPHMVNKQVSYLARNGINYRALHFAACNFKEYDSSINYNNYPDGFLPVGNNIVSEIWVPSDSNWHKITSSFKMNEDADHLIFGTLRPLTTNDFSKPIVPDDLINDTFTNALAVYLDSICLYDVTFFAKKKNFTVCDGQPIFLETNLAMPVRWLDMQGNELDSAVVYNFTPSKSTQIKCRHYFPNAETAFEDTISITVLQRPKLIITRTNSLCNIPALLNGDAGLDAILWSNGSTSKNTSYYDSGMVWAKAFNSSNCVDSESFRVKFCSDSLNQVVSKYHIPTAFTPDANGLNDLFKPVIVGWDLEALTIYSRWGEKIFESFDPNAQWDGKYLGKICSQGNYVYVLTIKTPIQRLSFTGIVTLLR